MFVLCGYGLDRHAALAMTVGRGGFFGEATLRSFQDGLDGSMLAPLMAQVYAYRGQLDRHAALAMTALPGGFFGEATLRSFRDEFRGQAME